MDRIAHPLEVRLSKELGHGRGRNSCRLRHKHRMAAFLVTTGIMGVVFFVVMQIHGFAAEWTGGEI